MAKSLIDVNSPNFDLYIASFFPRLTEQSRELLPKDISWSLFKSGNIPTPKRLGRMHFLAKLFVLWRVMKKRWWIVVEDEDGVSPEEFLKLHQAKKKEVTIKSTEGFKDSSMFVLGNKELMDAFDFLNTMGASSAYNYLVKSKNIIPSKSSDWKDHMSYIIRFLIHYEANKKAWMHMKMLNIPEWYVLMSMYHGKEMKGSHIYNKDGVFRSAYASSATKIKVALGTLQQKGYIIRTGIKNGAFFRITSLGTQLVNQIVEKHIVNC